MNEAAWIFSFYLTQFKNRLMNPGRDALIKFVLILIFGALFFPVIYQLFYFIFKHFYSVPLIGGMLVGKILNGFFMTFSIMIFLSSIVASIPVLYLSRDMDFLFSSPLSTVNVFAARCVKIAFGASWMVMLMSVPVFLAYKNVLHLGFPEYFFILACHIPFFAFISSFGILASIMLVRYFPAENVRNIAVAFTGIFAAVLIVYFRMLQPEKLAGTGFAQVNDFVKNLAAPDYFFLPHSFFMGIVRAVTSGGIYAGLQPFFYFISAALLALSGVIAVSKTIYFEGYGKSAALPSVTAGAPVIKYRGAANFMPMASKDLKYLLRDTSQWIQVVFLSGIVFIYIFNLYKLPADLFGLKDFIFFLNIGFIGMVLAAAGSRFVLPVISSEGMGFWIYKTAPITMRRYVLYKFFTYGAPLVVIGQVVALISIAILKPGFYIDCLTMYSSMLITIVIAAAGAGFGGYFAKFEMKNPEDLITGPAGLSYMFVTFLFVAGMLACEAGVVRDFYLHAMVKAVPFRPGAYMLNYILMALAAAAVSAASLAAGINKLDKMEH